VIADPSSAGLRALAGHLVDSWNRVDSQAFVGLFTPDAEYVTGAGERVHGRQVISQLVEQAALAAQVTLVEEPSAECDASLGLLTFAWSAIGPNGVVRRGTITCSCVRHGDSWRIQSLRNNEAGSVGETTDPETS